MMLALGHHAKNQLLLVGLQAEDLGRLIIGNTITMTTQSHGRAIPLGLSITLAFGSTEQDLIGRLVKAGAVTSDATVHIMPPPEPSDRT